MKERLQLNGKKIIKVKREIQVELNGQVYYIGEFPNGAIKCYILEQEDISCVWSPTELERFYYDEMTLPIALAC